MWRWLQVLHDERALGLILSLHHRRTLSKYLTCQLEDREYQVLARGQGYTLRRAAVTVSKSFDGNVTLLYRGLELEYQSAAGGSGHDANYGRENRSAGG